MVMTSKYDAVFKDGKLMALNTETGEYAEVKIRIPIAVFDVETRTFVMSETEDKYMYVYASDQDGDAPYEIYINEMGALEAVNLDTGVTGLVALVKTDE